MLDKTNIYVNIHDPSSDVYMYFENSLFKNMLAELIEIIFNDLFLGECYYCQKEFFNSLTKPTYIEYIYTLNNLNIVKYMNCCNDCKKINLY